MKNHQIVLAARPEGEPRPDHFRIVESDLPKPADGQVLVKTLWLSLDPYMRGRMSAAKSYARPVEIGDVMVGHTVGRGRRVAQPGAESRRHGRGLLGLAGVRARRRQAPY